jgi:hypothetical protein
MDTPLTQTDPIDSQIKSLDIDIKTVDLELKQNDFKRRPDFWFLEYHSVEATISVGFLGVLGSFLAT